MSENAIVLLSPVAANGEALASSLREAGHGVTVAASTDAAIAAASGHSILIVVGLDDASAAAACRRVREIPVLREIGVCVLTASEDVEARVALLTAGADEVVPVAIDPRELEARLGALFVRSTRGLAAAATATGAVRRPNRSIAIVSPSGGTGTTTIAVGLALVLAARQPGRVAVADMHLPFGQVASHLDIQPRRTITDLAADDVALVDPSLIATYAERHPSGLSVYPAPGGWDSTAIMTPQMAVAFIETATLAHDRVVIDLGSAFDDRCVAVLGRADVAIVPVRPEVPSLRAVHSFVDALAAREVDPAKLLFVVNQMAPREALRPQEIETALGRPPAAELPYDAALYIRAANHGVPIVTSAPDSAPAVALMQLAAIVLGEPDLPVAASAPPGPEKRPAGLFGGLFGSRG
jgi:pilus assembly protein CpaE